MMLWMQISNTGRPLRWSSNPVVGWTLIETDLDPLHIYVHDGQVLPLPPSPGDDAVFDPANGTWSVPTALPIDGGSAYDAD